jgi:uncharacterized lipoprotein YmbA
MKTTFLTLVLLSLTGCGEPQTVAQQTFRLNNRRTLQRHQ